MARKTSCHFIPRHVPGHLLHDDRQPPGGAALIETSHAPKDVEIVELSVDLGRDTPARRAPYARLTGATWELVTEPPGELRRMAKFLGFSDQKVQALRVSVGRTLRQATS